MKALVVYDSQFGNTEKVARAIARTLKSYAKLVSTITSDDLRGLDLLVVGSPTQGGRHTVAVQQFLNTLPAGCLKGVKVAAFDTRFLEENLGFWPRLLVKTIGYAAPKMAIELSEKGGTLIAKPEGFIVSNTKGPLLDGELKRARHWLANVIG